MPSIHRMVALAAAALAITSAPPASAALAARSGGERAAGPLPVTGSLAAVTAISSGDAWAVGVAGRFGTGPLLAHWNGHTWQVAGSKALPSLGQLAGVAKFPGGAWAVGQARTAGGRPAMPLIVRLAAATVRRVSILRVQNGVLKAVAAAGSAHAWAVGYVGRGPALIMRWNGTAWTRARVPRRVTFLGGVAATSARNAWAVGDTGRGIGSRPVILHWNGSRWSPVTIPAIRHGYQLVSVAAVSARDAWAVGFTNGLDFPSRTVILHWKGRAWKRVPSPDPFPGGEGDGLAAVAASSAGNAWVVGNSFTGPFGGPFTERWDGTSWTTVPVPVPAGGAILAGIAISPSGRAWAVGSGLTATLILHWNGTAWH